MKIFSVNFTSSIDDAMFIDIMENSTNSHLDLEQEDIYSELRKNNSGIEVLYSVFHISGCLVSIIGIIGKIYL
jgi:hypothetical protein